jgi:hypothetical protein
MPRLERSTPRFVAVVCCGDNRQDNEGLLLTIVRGVALGGKGLRHAYLSRQRRAPRDLRN